MILLDTNVISEPLRHSPEACVIQWIDEQALETLYLSAMTVAELRAGVALMPVGRRRSTLHESLEKQVLPMFVGRVLPFDLACTQAYAEVLAKARKAGSGIEAADACPRQWIHRCHSRYSPVPGCRSDGHQSLGAIEQALHRCQEMTGKT
mgnify:CR=1 FL=1